MFARLAALGLIGLLAGCAGGGDAPRVDAGGAQIATIRVRPGNPPRFALATVRPDGASVRELVRAPGGGIERLDAPTWSPAGDGLYFIGVLAERVGDEFSYYEADAFAVDLDGGPPRRVTRSRDVHAAVPSPDGDLLLLERDERPGRRPFTRALWLADASGANLRRLTDAKPGQLDRAGSWSPDGRAIAFTRCRVALPNRRGLIVNTCAIHTVSREGTMLRRLATRSSDPAFSPDGRQIAFVSDRDEHGDHATGSDEAAFANELYVMDADGGDERRLTETKSLDEAAPSWSPDGRVLAYAREGPARFTEQVMMVTLDGACAVRVIGNAAARRATQPWFGSPAWRPTRDDAVALACG